MPELPEIEALAAVLRERCAGRGVRGVVPVSLSALKTVRPAPSELVGAIVADVGRHGKFLDITVQTDEGPRHLVMHLARAGWLRWRPALPAAPPKPGSGNLVLRVALTPTGDEEMTAPGRTPGFDVTEAGTRKRAAVYVVTRPDEVPGIAALGPDALDERLSPGMLGLLGQAAHVRLKRWLTDQTVIAGIGNAYSDEILHTARLSPFRLADSLTPEEYGTLFDAVRDVLTDAVARSAGTDPTGLKAEKRTGMRVHSRTGLPCPVCGDTVREVSYAESSFQYCPTCQTGGRILADRRLSRLVR